MPLYVKVSVQHYGSGGRPSRGTLDDLQHESRRLVPESQDQALVFKTPHNWHKKFIDALLQPESWQPPPAGHPFAFAPADLLQLCDLVEVKLKGEPTLLEVHAPVKVFGDIHGQYADLMHLFRAYGTPSRLGDISCVDYLFLGDYVDRGEHSLETICLLFALKVEFPAQVHLLRGNHEVSELNAKYGFKAECKRRLGAEEGERVWRRINEVFDWLPLAARIDGRILCMHGGISSQLAHCEQITAIERPLSFQELGPDSRLAYQLLWNDPNANDAVLGSHASNRGGGIQTFSAAQVEEFCQANGLELIIRAHQCVRDGIERFARGRLVTVFSATNYCGSFDNAGALLLVGRDHVVIPKLVHPSPPKLQGLVTAAAPAVAVAGPATGGTAEAEVVAEPAAVEKPKRQTAAERQASLMLKLAESRAREQARAATVAAGEEQHAPQLLAGKPAAGAAVAVAVEAWAAGEGVLPGSLAAMAAGPSEDVPSKDAISTTEAKQGPHWNKLAVLGGWLLGMYALSQRRDQW